MTDFKVLRYFAPTDSDTFTAGWYLTDNDDGLTRVGDMIPADDSAVYGVANQIIIDSNTPDDSTAGGVSPLSGGAGLDQFLITSTANSVTIDDDSGDNMIVFALDVEIKSITSEASGVSPVYVITLSTDKVITVRNPSSFTFQHLGDTTRTAPISAAEFLTAYPNQDPVAGTDIEEQSGTAAGQEIKPIDLSGLFTDSNNDELALTFAVMLDGSTIDFEDTGLKYDPLTKNLFGTPNSEGTYTITVTASDSRGGTDTSTFNIVVGPFEPVIELSNLVYNVGGEVIVISQDNLLTSHGSQEDLSMLVYLIQDLPTNGTLWKGDAQLDDQSGSNSFTQEDVNNGLITYRSSDSSSAQSDSFSFVVLNSAIISPKQVPGVFQITPREDVDVQNLEEDNTIDRSGETAPQKIDTGDGSDTITGGEGDDQIDAGAGDDEITLTRDDNGEQVDAGADEVLYTFGYGGDGTDGSDAIRGFKRGQDKLKLVVNSDRTDITTLTAFLESLEGADGEALTDDDAFIITMVWGFDENGVFYFDGVLLHFKEASAFSNGPLSSPVVSITFDERLDFDDLVEILGGAENVANNFDGGLTAFKNLDEVLPRLFGEDSIDFEVRPIDEVSVVDGPVASAEVFFDLNGDGAVTDAEKDAQRDESGRSRYLTGDDGTVDIPEQYVGRAFVAVVGSAYDIDSGERLEGEFRSLDEGRGGIATPITDLIVTYLEEVEGQAGTPTTEQEVLDEIFGDDEVTLADVLDAGNYELPESGAPGEAKKQMISRAAIALTEIKENDDLADGDGDGSTTKVEIVSALKTLVDSPDDSSVADLKAAVEARVAEVNAVRGGKPIATPASVDGVEDTDYAFPDTPEALTGLFGFRDPSGNDPAADTSSFRGVYIRIAIENASLRLDDNTQIVADTDLSGSDTADAIVGYVYVTFDKLSALKLSPAGDFNGDLALVYRVWDGEEVSSDAELIINIAGVNDAPVAGTDIGPQSGTVGEKITDIDLSGLFTDIDGDEVVLTFTVTLAGSTAANADTGLSIRNDMLTGTLSGSLAAGDYTITVTATDPSGEMDTSEFTFTVLEKTIEATEGGNAATIVENDLVTYFATGTLTSSVSGTITLDGADGDGNLEGTYGTMTFDGSVWRYELNNEDDDTQMLRDGDTEEEVFTFRDGTTSFTVTITVSGVNDAPVVESGDEIIEQAGRIGQEITAIDLSGLFTDVDTGDTLTLTVVLDDGSALSTIGLSYDPVANEITGTPILTGLHTIKVAANDGSVTSVATFDIVVAPSDSILGYVGQFITEIDLRNLFTNPSGVKLTVTFLDSGGNEVDNTGLEYNPVTAKITGTPAITGTYTIKAVLSNPAGTQIGEATIFNLVLKALQPPTLTFVDAQVEANADFTIIEDSDQPAGPIVPINLSTLFATVNGQRVTVTLENGDALSTIGLEYSSTSKAVTGALTKFGTFTIVASGGGKTGTFIVTTDPYKTPTEVIQIDDPDVLFDNPHLSSRNQVGIRVGAKGGSADDVAAARTDLKSDYGDSDVRVFAPTDTTDTEEEFIVEGEYGRFVITLLRGGDAPDGSPAELRYYYERYQDGDTNYKNINALKEGEIAYDVLTIWAFDGFTDVEFGQLIDSDGNTPQSAVDRQVFKTVVVEVTGANDAPEVVSETFDVLFITGEAVSIAIDPANFFDVDGDELGITVTLGDDSALGTINLAYDPVTGKITGVPNAAGSHTIKVTATDGGSESASYTFVLSSNAGDVNTQPVVVISGEQELEVIAGIEVASDTDTGFDITYSDADDDHRDNDEVVYSFYQLGLDEDGNTIRIRPADYLLEVSEDGSIHIKAGFRFISDLRLEVVATDGEGSESVPQPFTITVLSRVPTASPATVAIDEDSDYAFPDAAQELTDLLGFADPEGNSDGQPASSFEGIYIKLSSIINGALLQDDNTVVDASSAEAAAPAKDGYIYVTLATLGGLKLRPTPDFNGDLDLVYQVWDGEDASGDATLTITVRGVNDVPVASDAVLADQNLRAGTTFEPMDLAALKALFTDVDGEDLDITVAFFENDGTTPAEIGLTYSDATGIVGTLNNDLSSGDYKVTITANDGTATAERTFTITAVNDTPTAIPMGGVEIDEDTDYVFAGKDLTALFGFSDPEGNSDGQPTSSFEGIYIKQDSILNGTLFFVPSDGTAATELDLSAIGGYFYVPLSILGKLKFTPDPNFNGAMELVYQVRDGEEVSGDATLTITVNAVNDVPELLPNTEIENQDENVGQLIDPISEGDLRARFADADTDNAALVLTVMVLDGSTRTALDTIGLEYNSTDGIIGTPNDAGTYTIEVTASDGEESIAFTFDIVVVHPPVIAIGDGDPTEIGEDTESPITGTLTITDQDSSGPFQSIVLTDDSDDADDGIVMGDYGTLTFDSDTNAWSYMVDERAQALNDDAPGTDRFVFTSEGATDFELVITVTGSNDAPEIAKVDMDLEGVETILGNIEGGRLNRLIVQDSDADASVFTSESFTITGDQAEKFIVKKDDDGRWYLFLKDGESLDHADLEEVTLNLQIKVSDGINESNTVDINIGAARGYFLDENAHGGVVYQARAEGDAAGTRYSIKSGISEGDLFIIDGEDGEVRFKPSSIPVTFDIDGEFSFIIIERSGGDVTETVVTFYNNVPSVFSRATSADSPEDQALGYTIGPDEPTDADGVASIEYYWFAHTRPLGALGTSNDALVAGEHATVKPLEGENDRLLTLKREHIEKEIWLIIVLTDEDGFVTYNSWAPNPGRYDIADTIQTALDLADIGMSNNDNSGDFDFVGDIGNSDSDYIKFTVEPGETLVIDIGGPGSYEAKYRVIREDGSPVENQSETLVRRDAREDLNLLEAGTYILRVTQQGQSAGPYKVSFQGIDDKPTALALSDTVTELASVAELSAGQKVGVLTITDDTYGTNTIILAGADVALFEIRETSNSDRLVKELWLKAGINFSTRGGETFNVIASVEGTGEGSNPAPETFKLNIRGAGGGAPTADPMTSIEIMEDQDYEFPSTTQGLMDLFGFADPEGNSEGQTVSSFEGVYIKIANDNGTLMFIAPGGSETEVTAGNASMFDLGDAPAKPGYVYVTLANLEKLKLSPNLDFNGNLNWVYQVWDGEDASEDATLSIAVTPVNDAPRVADGETIGDVTVDEGDELKYNLRELFTDPENGRLATFRAQVFSGSLERELVILESPTTPEKIQIDTGGGGEYRVVFTVGDNEGAETRVEFTLTITVNPVPVLFRMDLEGVETILGNIEGGRLNRLIVKDSDTDASVFTSESFTITGDQAEKFIVKKDDDGRWYLFLKDGESLDHADLEEVTLNLQIKVSDGINESNTVDINIGAARGYFFDRNDHGGVVYQARAEGDAAGTRYSIKSGIREGDLFIIDGENGEVTFEPGSIPATFDIDGEFSFIIIERSGGDVTETVVTFYNNVLSVVSPATSADSPEDRALGYIIGPDEPTDADGVASIEYYWFAHTRPRGELRGISNENLVAGEHATVKPLEGENDRLLTLKREHIEKEIWLIIVLTDEDGFVTYNFWAPNPGRYDIADTIETALDLADIGMSNNDNSGDFDYVGDIGHSDSDYIKFTVEPSETLDIKVGGLDSRDVKYTVIREDGSAVENQSETRVFRAQQKTLNTLEAGTYILRVTQQGRDAGRYKVSFQGIDDKPTAFVLSDTVTELASDAELSAGQKVGVLTITDDTYGTNTIILAGADVALFEIRETSNSDRLVKELWLKADINFSTRGGETLNVIASVEGTGEGSNPAPETFELNIRGAVGGASGASDETDPGAVLGNGIEGAVIGDETDTLGQILIGGDNAQTLNAGEGGDMIIGGRGDDTINLGTGADTVLYRYDGAEDTAPTAHDGGDVINDFDVDEDTLILAEAENESIYTDTAEFYDAIKGVSLIVDGDGNITGVVFTFAGQDGPDQDAATQEIDLTVNFEEDDFVTPSDIDLTAFEDAEDGERAITDGEETAAYEVIDAILGNSVELANFDDLGIELNPAETDII